jgi:hypothetical protein
MNRFLLALALALGLALNGTAEDKKPDGPVVLTVVAKTDMYKFDGGGKTAAEFKKDLEAAAKAIEKGEPATLPKALTVDLVLRLTNTSKEEVTIYAGGTANVYTFELSGGAGVVALPNRGPMPGFIRLPQAITLAPGKSHEFPITRLSDGRRGLARSVFWAGPGEYKLSAKYLLTDAKGGKGTELISEPVKITVTDK